MKPDEEPAETRPPGNTPATGLQGLLDNPRIWRAGSRHHGRNEHHIPTGYAILDALLPGGGWLDGALTEIIVRDYGSGELQLVVPALARLSRHTGQTTSTQSHEPVSDSRCWIAWVAPPYIPYAPAMAEAGVNIARVLVVQTAQDNDALWAAEQALYSGVCAAVLVWAPAANAKRLRRLQLGAEQGGCWGIVFRSPRALRETSPAATRLWLDPGSDGGVLHLLKSRGGRPRTVMADFLTP